MVWMEKTPVCVTFFAQGFTDISLPPKPFSPGLCLAVVLQGRPWQGKGREQRKQEGRRSCIPSLLLIILLFLLREASRSANPTLGSHLGRDPGR